MVPVRFAIAGVGNVASALVQGLVRLNRITGIESVAKPTVGFDVHSKKVGNSLGQAIRIAPNCASWLNEDLNAVDAPVLRGPSLDGLSAPLRDVIPVDDNTTPVDLVSVFRETNTEVLVILLPTGAQQAAEAYAQSAISAGCAVVNGMPACIAKQENIVRKATDKNIPIIGDDIKSQVGATIIHRALMDVFLTRDAKVERTIQLDWGGDTDFLNLVRGRRYEQGKRASKTESVIWNHPETDAHISAVDYIPFLENKKEAYTRLEGRIFGGQKVRIDVNMEVEDAYNSAGVLVHAIKCAGLARRCNMGGVLESASAWLCKHPPNQLPDSEAHQGYESLMSEISDV